MSPELLERPSSSEALSDYKWRPRETGRPVRRPGRATDMTSVFFSVQIPFGSAMLVLSELPPPWMHDLLSRISQLGDLEEGWDSYGARRVDPEAAAATVEFLFNFLGHNTPQPAVVPTSRGGIQLEWHRAGADLEVEIESPARLRVFFEEEGTGKETETTLTGNFQPLVPLLDRIFSSD